MKRMTMRPVVAVLLAIVVTTALVTVYFTISEPSPPGDHKELIQKITIVDVTFNRVLQPKYLSGMEKTMMLSVTPMGAFKFGEIYTQTNWGFYSVKDGYEDLNAVVSIWGPGDDGKSYSVEVGRLMGNGAKIFFDGDEKGGWDAGTNEGHVGFTVSLE